MNNLKIHHIGYLVKRIEKAIKAFEDLGFVVEKPSKIDSTRNVSIAFLIKDGYRIELVSPISEESVVFNLLKKYKNSPYHICYESDKGNFEHDIELLINQGYVAIDKPTPAPCIDGRRVVFLMNPSLGMVELLEY